MRNCPAEDDNGVICGKPMSHREYKQDGMCSRCADLIWGNFAEALLNNREPTRIDFNDE